jgi:UPF0042 nucleotide-binding protein
MSSASSASAEAPQEQDRLVFMTGLSGSGKSAAMNCFEDMGFFCSDNVPTVLIPAYLDELRARRRTNPKVMLVVDVRERDFFEQFIPIVQNLKKTSSPKPEIVFLESSDEVLVRRFSETKRPHPLAFDTRAIDGIKKERAMLADVRDIADMIIDTSNFNTYQLREHLHTVFQSDARLIVSVQSFGYKFGVPLDADLVFDVRFLKNPHYVPELKPKTGLDAAVRDHVFSDPEATPFLERLSTFIRPLMPLYIREGKAYLNVAIGCTGGRHRSVTIAEELASRLQDDRWRIHVSHRDAAK